MQGTAKFSVEHRMQNYKVKHHQPKGSKEKNFRGETVVTDGQLSLRNGSRVNVRNPAQPAAGS